MSTGPATVTSTTVRRDVTALCLPFVACAVQWLTWPVVKPLVLLLFYPAAFFASQIGSLRAGIAATGISAALTLYFFIPPQLHLAGKDPNAFVSVAVFVIMGVLFAWTHERLRREKRRAADALAGLQRSNEEIRTANTTVTKLYEKSVELDRLKSQFFASVSHELRTPLALILGIAKRSLSAAVPEDLRHDLEVVTRNARLLHRHVDDILDVAKAEA